MSYYGEKEKTLHDIQNERVRQELYDISVEIFPCGDVDCITNYILELEEKLYVRNSNRENEILRDLYFRTADFSDLLMDMDDTLESLKDFEDCYKAYKEKVAEEISTFKSELEDYITKLNKE